MTRLTESMLPLPNCNNSVKSSLKYANRRSDHYHFLRRNTSGNFVNLRVFLSLRTLIIDLQAKKLPRMFCIQSIMCWPTIGHTVSCFAHISDNSVTPTILAGTVIVQGYKVTFTIDLTSSPSFNYINRLDNYRSSDIFR